MPYTLANPPSTVKNLPKGAQKLFIDAFNAVFDDTGDETKARMAGWNNVKNKYKKVGGKWVLKEALRSPKTGKGESTVGFSLSDSLKSSDKAVLEAEFSDKPWSQVNKTELPSSCFLIVGDSEKKTTWKLPYKEKGGKVNKGALRAILALMGGARGGVKGGISSEVKDKVLKLAKQAGIASKFSKEALTQIASEASDIALAEYIGTANVESEELGRSFEDTKDERESKIRIEVANLTEAVFDSNNRTVEVTIIAPGWSLNERYYSKEVCGQIVKAAQDKRKVFVNHILDQRQLQLGRDMRDWAATVKETWQETGTGAAKAKIEVFTEPDGAWLFERMQKYPEEVGLSIDARARVKEGSAEGKKGVIVLEILRFYSFDFVTYAAAGGGVTRLAAAVQDGQFSSLFDDCVDKLIAADDISEFQKRLGKQLPAFVDSLATIGYSDNAGESGTSLYHTVRDYTSAVEDIWTDTTLWPGLSKTFDPTPQNIERFLEQLDLSFKQIFKTYQEQDKFMQLKDALMTVVRGLLSSEIKPKQRKEILVDALDNFKKEFLKIDFSKFKPQQPGGTFDVVSSTVREEKQLDELTLAILKEQHPDLVDEIRAEKLKEIEASKESKDQKDKLEALAKENVELKEKLDGKDKELDGYQLKERVAERKDKIRKLCKEHDLGEDYVSEVFEQQLLNAKDDKEVEKLIEDRSKVVKTGTGKVEGVGASTTKTLESEGDRGLTDEAATKEFSK